MFKIELPHACVITGANEKQKRKREKKTSHSVKKTRKDSVYEGKVSNYPLAPGETYTSKYGVKRPPIDHKEQNALGDELIAWAREEGSVAIEDFPLGKNISPKRFFGCAKYNEYFRECVEIARGLIGSRLFKGALSDDYNQAVIMKTLPRYNEEVRELQMDHVKQLGGGQKTVEVVMEKFPDSPEVPPVNSDDTPQ